MIASLAILTYSCLLLVEWTEGRLGKPEPPNDLGSKGIQSGPAKTSFFGFDFDGTKKNKCHKYTFSQCIEGNLHGTDEQGHLLYSDRINSEDREHGAMQCQSLCERVYDDYTYWIYRLQEQTCECWSKTAPEDYLGNCTERAWYPTPEMSEISKDNLCHLKEDSKGCSKIKFLQCQYGPDRGKPSPGIDKEDKCQAICMTDKKCKFYEWKQDDKGQYDCKKHFTDHVTCMWVFGPKGAPKFAECMASDGSDVNGSNENTDHTTNSPDETSKDDNSNDGPVESHKIPYSSNENESKYASGNVDDNDGSGTEYEKELKRIKEHYEKELLKIKEKHKIHGNDASKHETDDNGKYKTHGNDGSKHVTDDTSKYVKIKCKEPWCKVGAEKTSASRSLVNSNLEAKDINVNIDGGNNTHIDIKGNSSSKESNINDSSKNGNDNSGTQRIISITHGNKNTFTKDDQGGANGGDSNSSGPKSRSTQRIISVTQPESARNKAHGYSVDGPTNDPALKKSDQSRTNSDLEAKDINLNIHGGDNTRIGIDGDLNSKDSDNSKSSKNKNDESSSSSHGTQRIISITHGNENAMGARDSRKMHSRSRKTSDLEGKDINLNIKGGNNTKIEIKGDSDDNKAMGAKDNGSADKPDGIGANDNIKEGGMDMKAIDISISGDFNISIMNDEKSGDSTTDKDHGTPGQTTDHPLPRSTADVR